MTQVAAFQSNPSDKNNCVMVALALWSPTLAAKNKGAARMGHPGIDARANLHSISLFCTTIGAASAGFLGIFIGFRGVRGV